MTKLNSDRFIDPKSLDQFALECLVNAGLREDIAASTAAGLTLASLRGIDSHGIRLLPHYYQELHHGRINPNPDISFHRATPAVGHLDADDTFGIAAGTTAVNEAVALAKDSGVGHVAVRNSSHCGSLASFALKGADAGFLTCAMTHSTANTRTAGGTRPFFGNNPICVTAPMRDEPPFCFDSATTLTTFNEIRRYREAGRRLPPNVAADDAGEPTRDPHAATQLLPIGTHEGFGLSMVGDIFSGLLTGMPVGPQISSMFGDPLSEPRKLGHYVTAIDVDVLVDADSFATRLQELADAVRAEPPADPDTPVMVPGDPEKQTERRRWEVGIPIPDGDLERLNDLAEAVGTDPLV